MKQWIIAALASCTALGLQAETLEVQMHAVTTQGTTESLGSVKIESTAHGLVFRPELAGLEPGAHGFHLHAEGSCEPSEKDGKVTAAGAAGGHWDPQNSGRHGEPWGDGHMGDLPPLMVDVRGLANQPVLAPRLKNLDEIRGLALMIHQGGDNHSDQPEPLGGGGVRVGCGVIQ